MVGKCQWNMHFPWVEMVCRRTIELRQSDVIKAKYNDKDVHYLNGQLIPILTWIMLWPIIFSQQICKKPFSIINISITRDHLICGLLS